MIKKRFLAGMLSAAMALSVAVFNPTVVKAAGWLDDVKEIETGVTYSGTFSLDEDYYETLSRAASDPNWLLDYRIYDAYRIDVPEDGIISLSWESSDGNYGSYDTGIEIGIYGIDDVDNIKCWSLITGSFYSGRERGLDYSSARGLYYVDDLKYGLSKGTYYVLIAGRFHYDTEVAIEPYSFTIDYYANVTNTRFKSCKKTKKGLDLNWNRVSDIDGYQIEYSTKEDFSAKKKTITIKDVKTVKQLVKGIKKKKTYYVRIRSYKYVKVNGEKEQFFSDWSETSTL